MERGKHYVQRRESIFDERELVSQDEYTFWKKSL